MNTKRVYSALAGALIAGVILGSASSGLAANGPPAVAPVTSSVSAACGSLGLQLGSAMRDSGGRLLDVVAKLTGKTTADVTTERQAGKTFTQIAAENNVSSVAVVDEALKVRQEILAAKVQEGTITQAQADTAAAAMKTRLTERVDSTNADCGSGGRGAGGGAGGRGAGCAMATQ
jgi:short-subunit dehydrogenase involved in D-alanine esterification of teichoic acids